VIAVGVILWLAFIGGILAVPVGIGLAVVGWIRDRAATRRTARAAVVQLRATDAERMRVLATLHEGFAVGRLSFLELEERAAEVWAGRTLAQVERAARELPLPAPAVAADRVRPWLRAASLYNLVWGAGALLAPVGLGWKATGIVLLAYAAGYRWAARDPLRDVHLVAVALLGKTLGPIAFLLGLAAGAVAPPYGLLILANDVVWWPAFFRFVRAAARAEGGWRAFSG
jgi:hypothetical protein